MNKSLPLYRVDADFETGQWLTKPVMIAESVNMMDHLMRKEVGVRTDVYNHVETNKAGRAINPKVTEMRAIEVHFVVDMETMCNTFK